MRGKIRQCGAIGLCLISLVVFQCRLRRTLERMTILSKTDTEHSFDGQYHRTDGYHYLFWSFLWGL